MTDTLDILFDKIKTLNETIWEGRVGMRDTAPWLANFNQDTDNDSPSIEYLHALYILARFVFFSDRQIRELLKSLYRDLFKYPIVELIRKAQNDTTDMDIINQTFVEELRKTRFIGIGRPSESGPYLLYYFRQENRLEPEFFVDEKEILIEQINADGLRTFKLRYPDITRYIFIDDFCGTGDQVIKHFRRNNLLALIKNINSSIELIYLVLVATEHGINNIITAKTFIDVRCIYKLDDSYKLFGNKLRYFNHNEGFSDIDKQFAMDMCLRYGRKLLPYHPLGFGNCQLLIGFHHNTPDDTLPIIWYDDPSIPWKPIFRRYHKI